MFCFYDTLTYQFTATWQPAGSSCESVGSDSKLHHDTGDGLPETSRSVTEGFLTTMMMMTTCSRMIPAPFRRSSADVRGLVSARCVSACWLERPSWRHRRAPVPARFSPVGGSWVLRLKGTDTRAVFWAGKLHNVEHTTCQPLLPHRGGHGRSAVDFRSFLSNGARGLCSRNSKETPDSPPAAEQNEAAPVPGEGLFKFKELVSNFTETFIV